MMDINIDDQDLEGLDSMNTDENIAGTSHLGEMSALEEEIDRLKLEVQEQKDKYLRLYADFDNISLYAHHLHTNVAGNHNAFA